MLKPNVKEHIHILKPRKKSKCEDMPPVHQPKHTLEYDLQIFQESLNFHKQKNGEIQYCQNGEAEPSLTDRSGALNDTTNSFQNGLNRNNHIKPNFNRMLNSLPQEQQKQRGFSSWDLNQYSSMHKAKICPKPNMAQNQKENRMVESTNHQKTHMNSTAADLKSEVLKQIKMTHKNQTMLQQFSQYENKQSTKDAYGFDQTKMKELQRKNKIAELKIEYLELKLREKEEMGARVDQIEKDLNNLYQENKELLNINECLSKLPINQMSDIQIQTDVFPVYVKDSFCQTIPFQLSASEETTETQSQQQVNLWRNQFERERNSAANKEIEFRVIMENVQIEHRQQIQHLQKQLFHLSICYQNKCQQIKQKDEFISKSFTK